MSTTIKALCALGVSLLSAEAGASLYEIQSSGLAADAYLSSSENAVVGQFDAAGVLPAGVVIRSATVQFHFQDEPDDRWLLNDSSYPQTGDYVALDPVYVGNDVYLKHVRPYYHMTNSLWRYERERVDVIVNGSSAGLAEPVQTSSSVRTETPTGVWTYDHGGSHDRYIGLDSSGNPVFGTTYIEYYNDHINIDVTRTEGNEEFFSFASALDPALYPRLAGGGSLSFALDTVSGDALFKSAVLTIETLDEGRLPEPSSMVLMSISLVGLGVCNYRRRPVAGAAAQPAMA